MNKVLTFAKREYKAAVRTKGFIIGLILAPVLMSGSLIAFLLLKDKVDTTSKTIVVVDRSGVIAPALIEAVEGRNANEIFDNETGEKVRPEYHLEVLSEDNDIPAQLLELSDRVRRGDIHAFLDIGADVIHPAGRGETARISYYAKNPAMDDVRRWLSSPINNQIRKARLLDAGVDETRVPDLFHWINVDAMSLVSVDSETGEVEDARRASEVEAILIPIMMMMLMFLMMMMSVPGMLQSVMEEKTQRIAEVLLSSISPFQFMMGKVVGGIAVSLTSSSVYILGGIILVQYMGYDQYIPYHVLPWFVTYMLLAVIMFGAMSAALGATCNEPKDAQSMTFPMLLPMLIPMFVYFPIVREPIGSLGTWMSLIPLFTPTLMVLRVTTPEAIPLWQPFVGLAGMMLFTLAFVWSGGRIFRVAILMQGTPPKFANIVRWAIRG